MKFDVDRDKALELFGKFIRTKNVSSLQGEQKTRAGQVCPPESKQKLQVRELSHFLLIFYFVI